MSRRKQSNRLKEADEALDKFQEERKNGSKPPKQQRQQGGKRPQGGKNFGKGKDVRSGSLSKTNDFDWYNRFPELVQSAATISFGKPLGNPFNLSQVTSGIEVADPKSANFFVPGIAAVYYYPTIGRSVDKRSAINRSALRLFTYMRSHLKTTGTYDSQDMMIMMVALDSLYAFHAWIKRLYGIGQLWTPTNQYYPEALLQANGVDPSFFTKGDVLMELRSYINTFAYTLGQYTIPYNVSLFTRHEWMNSGLYVDSLESSRAQTYMFVPMGFWYYDNTVTTGSELKFSYVRGTAATWTETDSGAAGTGGLLTFEQVKALGDHLLDGIAGDEDAGDISGDLLNAFGDAAVKHIDPVPEGYTVLPAYDKTVLMQIENADFVGDLYAGTSVSGGGPVITQDPSVNNGAILFNPYCDPTLNRSAFGSNTVGGPLALGQRVKLLNFHHDNPTAVEIIESTRLTVRARKIDFEPSANLALEFFQLDTFGSDLCDCMRVFYYQNDNGKLVLHGNMFTGASTLDTSFTLASALKAVNLLTRLSQFDWHPAHYVYQVSASSNLCQLEGVLQDLDYVGEVDVAELIEINDTVMLSLFDIPKLPFSM